MISRGLRIIALCTALAGAQGCAVEPNDARQSALLAPRRSPLQPVPDATGDGFGSAVALLGDYAFVGAPDAGPTGIGAVHVFARDSLTGAYLFSETLTPPSSENGVQPEDEFGAALAVSGSRLVVGAPLDQLGTSSDIVGSAYVFVRAGVAFLFERKLPGAVERSTAGASVAIDGPYVVVGAPSITLEQGAVYVYAVTMGYARIQIFPRRADGSDAGRAGQSVAVQGGVVVTGDPFSELVWVYDRSPWDTPVRLRPREADVDGSFGESVALHGERLFVGAPSRVVSGVSSAGAVDVFRRVGSGFVQEASIHAATPAEEGRFGASLSFDGATLVVGEPGAGRAHLYEVVRDAVLLRSALVVPVTDPLGHLSVAHRGGTVVVGQNLEESASLIEFGSALGAPCTTFQGCLSGQCIDGVCCESACGGGDASDCIGCRGDGLCEPLGDAASSTLCRAARGACDRPEWCSPIQRTCPADLLLPASTVCRAARGPCDESEVCDGTSIDCPSDDKSPPTTMCRGARGACDAEELCDGASNECPADVVRDATEVCREAAGECDVDERCNGVGAECPEDRFARGIVCREVSGACDAAELCDGRSATCSADLALATCCTSDEACDDDDPCTVDACGGEEVGCEHREIAGCCLGNDGCDDGDPCTEDRCDREAHVCSRTVADACADRDGGVTTPGDTGCDCVIGRRSGTNGAWLGLLVLGLAWRRRRRT